MNFEFDIWMFVAGLGIFLFGMHHLENGLKGLAGKSFKKLLQTFTNKRWKGILTGAFITAILQSSSLVTLLVQAFLGSGIISFQNSLGVVFGANLGTTVTAWVVATLGFKLNIAGLSYPFLAIGTLSYLMLDSRPVLKNWGRFLIGFGLLFLGLDFMKISIEQAASHIDLAAYGELSPWILLLSGVVVTMLIQSSSAMIVIVLSALNSELITIHQAAAMIIGANIGTTSTLVLASFKGTADKKRLAAANVIFNVVAGAVSFAFLDYLINFTLHHLHIKESLLELVFLNTLINLIGIVLFYPITPLFGRLMNRMFRKSEPAGISLFIKNVDPRVQDVALQALANELANLFSLTRKFILDCLLIKTENKKTAGWKSVLRVEENLLAKYNKLKQLEDEMTDYFIQIQTSVLSEPEAGKGAACMHTLRSMIYAAKDIKDVIPNINQIAESEDELSHAILKRLQEFVVNEMEIMDASDQAVPHAYDQFYNTTIDYLYKHKPSPSGVPVSSITNAIKKTVSAMENLRKSRTLGFEAVTKNSDANVQHTSSVNSIL